MYAYFGHHKTATRWIIDILDEVCAATGLTGREYHSVRCFDGDLPAAVRRDDLGFLYYTNADIDHVKQLTDVRGFHVVRDPRDMAVSRYFSDRSTHPPVDSYVALGEIRSTLAACSEADGLLRTLDQAAVFDRMRRWPYDLPDVLECRMEDLVADPGDGFVEILDFLGLLGEGRGRIDEDAMREIVHRHRFEVKAGGRAQGEEDRSSHYRRGQSGDWVNHFEPVHVEVFKERYNDLLLLLGYETDPDWSLPAQSAMTSR